MLYTPPSHMSTEGRLTAFDIAKGIGIMLIIILIGLLADKILFSQVEAWLHRKWGTSKD